MKKPTKLEKILADHLTKLNIKFRREYRQENYPVDFFLPFYKLSIQIDGTYHHGLCKKCSEKKGKQLHKAVKFQQERDKACILFHKTKGISIIRFCECEVADAAFLSSEIFKAIEYILQGYQYIRTRDL